MENRFVIKDGRLAEGNLLDITEPRDAPYRSLISATSDAYHFPLDDGRRRFISEERPVEHRNCIEWQVVRDFNTEGTEIDIDVMFPAGD